MQSARTSAKSRRRTGGGSTGNSIAWSEPRGDERDDHRDDGGGEIAARYAARDGRIRVARPPAFLGQVPNYNFALAQIAADTRYVKMVQADDMIFPRCLADMIALAEAHPTIGVVSAYRMFGAELQPNGL